jgi:hypothetical protein
MVCIDGQPQRAMAIPGRLQRRRGLKKMLIQTGDAGSHEAKRVSEALLGLRGPVMASITWL